MNSKNEGTSYISSLSKRLMRNLPFTINKTAQFSWAVLIGELYSLSLNGIRHIFLVDKSVLDFCQDEIHYWHNYQSKECREG